MHTEIEIRELTPERWEDFEALFASANGVCGGCWCMFWRLEKGERYAEVKGPAAKRRMKALVRAGKARGALAYVDGEPVGWLSYGPRRDYPKLDRAPSLACDDAEKVWSLPCFFVKAGFRGRGLSTGLLQHALKTLKKERVELAEAYPVKVDGAAPASSIYTGVTGLFAKAGFELVQERPRGKQRMRKRLRPARAR